MAARAISRNDSVPRTSTSLHGDAWKVAEAIHAFGGGGHLDAQLLEDGSARQHVCRPMRFFETRGLLSGSVLDYGSGRDPHDLPRYDPVYHRDQTVLGRRWRTIVCSYVLDAVLTESHREMLMLALRGLVARGGSALVSVRNEAGVGADLPCVHQTPEEWETFIGRYWLHERVQDTRDFTAWRLTLPKALVEGDQGDAQPMPTINVGPIVVHLPEGMVTVQPAKVEVPVTVHPTPAPQFEAGAFQFDVNLQVPGAKGQKFTMQKDARGAWVGEVQPAPNGETRNSP